MITVDPDMDETAGALKIQRMQYIRYKMRAVMGVNGDPDIAGSGPARLRAVAARRLANALDNVGRG